MIHFYYKIVYLLLFVLIILCCKYCDLLWVLILILLNFLCSAIKEFIPIGQLNGICSVVMKEQVQNQRILTCSSIADHLFILSRNIKKPNTILNNKIKLSRSRPLEVRGLISVTFFLQIVFG